MLILDIPCHRHRCNCFCLNNPDQLFFNDYSNFENRWFAMFFGKNLKNTYFTTNSKLKPESSECTFSQRFAFEKQNISQMIQLDCWVNYLGLGQWGSNRIRIPPKYSFSRSQSLSVRLILLNAQLSGPIIL